MAGPTLRRRPRRKSAEAIVDAVLRAAELILERDGVGGLSTNAIARVAGVSVGSVYQYFPDKLAIVAEMARRVEAAALIIASEEVVRLRDASPAAMIARVVALSCSPELGARAARRALLREVPRGWTLAETRATDALIGDVMTAFFAARAGEVRPTTAEAIFVVQHAVEGVVEAVLLACPDALPRAGVQRELFRLAWSSLAPNAASAEPLGAPAVDDELGPLLLRSEPRAPSLRKRASSARALATRAALIDATKRVLADGEEPTVRSIARAAGVGATTLYSHFPSVHDAVAGVAADIELRAARELEARLTRTDDLAGALVAAYTCDGVAPDALRLALITGVPRRSIESTASAARRIAIERLTLEIDGPDPSLTAFVVVHAVVAAFESFLLLRPPHLDRAGFEREIGEVVRRYLCGPPHRPEERGCARS